jgi:predicted lipoprotein with Yx(FWY)xxD motif
MWRRVMRPATAAIATPRATRGRPARLGAAVCAGVLAFGLYGLSGTAAAKSQPTVSIGKVKGLGKVLVDSKNHTLYSLVNNHQPVACTGACLDMFVPLTIKPGSKPKAGKGVSGLGVVAGGTQVTENNFPLFLFQGDKALRAKGEGLTSSGGTWQAAKVTGSSSGGKKSGGSSSGGGGVSF